MRLWRALPVLAAAVCVLALAPAARAAFPGRNGLLVVQPARASGLVLIDVHGRHRQTLCSAVALCGHPSDPRFSPSGQEIAFTDSAGHLPGVLWRDGSCLWCLLGPRLTGLTGARATFTGDGHDLAVAGAAGLSRMPLSGGRPRTLIATPLSDAVWAANGTVAYVRGGSIYVLPRAGRARWLAFGTAPDLSPDGLTLVFAYRGWVWSMPTAGGSIRRLVAGGQPVISPDGHQLAFLGSGGRLFLAGRLGRHARLVHGVRGRTLDWQPLPRHPRAVCRIPHDATVLARTGEAVVVQDPAHPGAPWSGCLQAVGSWRSLGTVANPAPGSRTGLAALALSGRFAAFVLAYSDSSGRCSNVLRRIDLASGGTQNQYTQNCSGRPQGIDQLGLDSSGFTAWHAFEQVLTPPAVTGIACPASTLCVAVDGLGNAVTSSSPFGGPAAWTANKVAPGFSGIDCPSAALCVGRFGGSVIVSTDPAGGPAAWSAPAVIDTAQITQVACAPSSPTCVAVDNAGSVLTTAAAGGGAAAWQKQNVAGTDALTGVSCPSVNLCVAVGQNGDVLTSTAPLLAGSWVLSRPESTPSLGGVSCPSTTLCVTSDAGGSMLTTADPVHGPWSIHPVTGVTSPVNQPVCPSTTFCLARGGRSLVGSTDPAGDLASASGSPSTWTALDAGSAGPLSGFSCPSTSLCAAFGSGDLVATSSDPGAATSTWSSSAVDTPACGACLSEQLYEDDDRGRQAADATQPGPGGVIAGVVLGGDSTTVSWTHAGTTRSFRLR